MSLDSRSRSLPFLLALAIGCGGGGSSGGPSFAFDLVDGEAPSARSAPFPSELYRQDDGSLDIPAASLPFTGNADATAIANLSRGFAERGCFGSTAGIMFPLADLEDGEELDEATLDGKIELVALGGGEPLPVEAHVRVFEDLLYVRAARGVILEGGRTYGAVIRRGVATTDGREVVADADLGAALAGDGDARAVRAFAPLVEELGDPDGVVGATVFTVCDADAELDAARAAAWSGPAPALTVDRIYSGASLDDLLGIAAAELPGGDNPGGVAHGTIAYLIAGSFPAANLQSAVPGELGRWQIDGDTAEIKGRDDVPVLIALPAGVDSYADLPVVVFQHGLGGSRLHAVSVANSLTARGYAVLSIDIPFHGDRFPEAGDDNHQYGGAPGPDGFADSSGAAPGLLLFDVDPRGDVDPLDPLVIADSFRQSALDLSSLARLIVEGDLGAVGAAEPSLAGLSLSPDRVVYSSESFGSIVGMLAVSFEPTYGAAFFSVGGGGILSDFLENSPTYGPLFMPILGGAYDVNANEVDPAFDPAHTHYAYQILSMLIDRGDPITYAHRMRERGVHVVLALAGSDEAVPNQSSEAIAAAMGLEWASIENGTEGPAHVDPSLMPPVATPVSGNLAVDGGAATGVVFALTPAGHAMLTSRNDRSRFEVGFPPFVNRDEPLHIDNPIDQLQALLADYVDSYHADGVPTLGNGAPVMLRR